MTKVVVVDYGASNLKSIVRGLERASATVTVAQGPEGLEGAAGLVIPGVGAAGAAMRGLRERGLAAPVRAAVEAGTPFLGVCLGMQLLFGPQEEDDATGLGLIEGHVRRLHGVKVPHMGWNAVEPAPGNEGPLAGLESGSYAYFVHSYYVELDAASTAIAAGTTGYGDQFVSAIARDNVWGTQFHPEKSGGVGARVLRNFVARCAGETNTSAPADPVRSAAALETAIEAEARR